MQCGMTASSHSRPLVFPEHSPFRTFPLTSSLIAGDYDHR